MNEIEYPDTKRSNWYLYGIALVASVGGFLFGFDLSLISGALIFLTDHFQLTPAMKGFAVSSAKLGCVAGPLFGLWFADHIGRRKTMMISALCFIVSAIGSALATTIWDFAIWRSLGGVGVGLASVASPIYIAEMSPPKLRSRLVNVNQLAHVLGINIAVLVSYALSFGGHWRWMFASEAVPIVFLFIGLLFIPKSPRWLATHNRHREALDVLTKIGGKKRAEIELDEIKKSLHQETGHFKDLLKPGIKLALFIGIVLMIFSQINGINMVLVYAPTILKEAGFGIASDAILKAMPTYFLLLVCTIIAFWLIARYTRRKLLITTVMFMGFAHILMALRFQQDWPSLTTLIPMLIGGGAFTLGFAPLSWIITSEIFPNRIRAKAMGVVCIFVHGSSLIVTQLFPMITHYFTTHYGSPAGAYYIFAGICAACVLFSWKMVPETKGLTLEAIGQFWLKRQGKEK